jgi:hypothetical protein
MYKYAWPNIISAHHAEIIAKQIAAKELYHKTFALQTFYFSCAAILG